MLEIVFLSAAVIGATIMVCQFLLTVIGMGGDGDMGHDAVGGHHAFDGGHSLDAGDAGADADFSDGLDSHHGHSHDAGDMDHPDSSWLFGVLSFRTLVAAAAFFGVTGETALSAGIAPSVALILAALVGFAAMYGMYWLMRAIGMLTSSGNEQIRNALGQTAYVYVAIPSVGVGTGKVQVSLQNRVVEYPAITDEEQSIPSGETVHIVELVGSDVLKVRRLA